MNVKSHEIENIKKLVDFGYIIFNFRSFLT
jgi:hypothetical protein